jgi:hypothetical protein
VVAPSGPEDDDAIISQNNAAAYNLSIYIMVGTPYFLLAGVSFLIYRGCKKNREYLRLHGLVLDDQLSR